MNKKHRMMKCTSILVVGTVLKVKRGSIIILLTLFYRKESFKRSRGEPFIARKLILCSPASQGYFFAISATFPVFLDPPRKERLKLFIAGSICPGRGLYCWFAFEGLVFFPEGIDEHQQLFLHRHVSLHLSFAFGNESVIESSETWLVLDYVEGGHRGAGICRIRRMWLLPFLLMRVLPWRVPDWRSTMS